MVPTDESKQVEDLRRGCVGCLTLIGAVIAFSACVGFFSQKQLPPPPLSKEQKEDIISQLRNASYPEPQSLEVREETGFVVATFEVVPSQIPDGGEAFATDALLKIRERLLPSGKYKQFTVTLNGPSKYSGIIYRYGSARFAGGQVVWQKGK